MEIILALQDHGDAYLAIDGDDFSVLADDLVVPRWDESRTVRTYWSQEGRQFRTDGLGKNLFVISINRAADDLTGIGWMESDAVRQVISIQRWSQSYFENNSEPTGLMLIPGTLTKQEAAALKAQVEGRNSGNRAPLYLTGGMTWETTSFSAQASQWVESAAQGVGDIARLSGVPSHFLAHSVTGSNLTYTNVSDIWALYYQQTLHTTYISRIQHAWSSILGTEVLFDAEQLLVDSLEQRVRSAAELVRTGWEPDQSLDVVGLPPIPHSGEIPVTLQKEIPNATI
jgi:HK97 family phage portal protein